MTFWRGDMNPSIPSIGEAGASLGAGKDGPVEMIGWEISHCPMRRWPSSCVILCLTKRKRQFLRILTNSAATVTV